MYSTLTTNSYMTVNDLKMDLITLISQVSDIATLQRLKATVEQQTATDAAIWKGADTPVSSRITFEDMMVAQAYRPVSFEEFTAPAEVEGWEASLEELLSLAD